MIYSTTFTTPREAGLAAELEQVKAQNAWYREHLGKAASALTQIREDGHAFVQANHSGMAPAEMKIAGSVEVGLARDGRLHVMSRRIANTPEALQVVHYFPSDGPTLKDAAFINHVLPVMYETILRDLTALLVRKQR